MTETLDVAQHTEAHADKVKGYKKLTDTQIHLINEIKAKGQELEALLANVQTQGADPRWLAMARTDLQVGLMKLTRSVAQPEFF